ncbi:por secretion system C-terminal sorting domain-containing protein [Elysia marginata]|uniref:Por secretion system C-terminal sorting domain-containing protein n=1 Tax=Elysia marginata TaxID=1093978 RepID=A0AAV4JC35_9GAST|nr:por secretion system C-terminal sorting domain-containing protein [Elysia marginata]
MLSLLFANSVVMAQKLSYCGVSGNGDYNLSKASSRDALGNINYYGKHPEDGYEYFKDGKLSVELDSMFTLMVMHSNTWSRTEVWIDWNADGDFKDKGEHVNTVGAKGQKNITPLETTIKVPKNAKTGQTRMRLQTIDAWTEYFAPCGEVWNSSTKDFDVDIR